MSIFQRLALILTGFTLIAFAGFYVGFRMTPEHRSIDSILFSSDDPSLIEPRWLVSYLKNGVGGNYPHVEIEQKDQHPIFRRLIATRYPPSSLYVHYSLRDVTFIVDDYANLGLDNEGVVIALHPFHTPKRAIHVFLGNRSGLKLGGSLDNRLMEKLLSIKNGVPGVLGWVDLSKMDVALPHRTINLGLTLESKTLLVRLHPDRLPEGLGELRAFLSSVPIIGMGQSVRLDLRHKGMGFLQALPAFSPPV